VTLSTVQRLTLRQYLDTFGSGLDVGFSKLRDEPWFPVLKLCCASVETRNQTSFELGHFGRRNAFSICDSASVLVILQDLCAYPELGVNRGSLNHCYL
jgi:hypothetical protein